MKKILNNIRTWWNRQCETMRKNNAQRKRESLVAEAEQKIQVKEFDGKVWFSVNGMPLLEAEDLTLDFASTLASARASWVAYSMNERTADIETPTYHGDR